MHGASLAPPARRTGEQGAHAAAHRVRSREAAQPAQPARRAPVRTSPGGGAVAAHRGAVSRLCTQQSSDRSGKRDANPRVSLAACSQSCAMPPRRDPVGGVSVCKAHSHFTRCTVRRASCVPFSASTRIFVRFGAVVGGCRRTAGLFASRGGWLRRPIHRPAESSAELTLTAVLAALPSLLRRYRCVLLIASVGQRAQNAWAAQP